METEGVSFKRNGRDMIKMAEATDQQQRLEDSKINSTNAARDSVNSEKVSSKGWTIRLPVWLKDYFNYPTLYRH